MLASKRSSSCSRWISLDACLGADLKWERGLALAQESKQRRILWELELGIEQEGFCLEDEFAFQNLSLAVSHFAREVFPRFEKETLGVVLYQGPLDLTGHLRRTMRQEENFAAFSGSRRLFCLESYLAYIQLLAAKLPDEVDAVLLIDAAPIPAVEALALLSGERFGHFRVAVKNLAAACSAMSWEGEDSSLGWIGEGEPPKSRGEPQLGVCLPAAGASPRFAEVLASLKKPYRVVSEERLAEEWDGLEELVVIEGSLTARGERMVKGFIASGGGVIWI